MPCPSEQTLFDFLERTLEAERAGEVRLHLDGCGDCREVVAETARAVVGRPTRLQAGATVGRYVLVSEIGAGAMGVVWSAHDPELERHVAVKVLRPELADRDARSRMMREARAMARLAHPNVVAVYDVGDHGEQVFVAMELVPGATLAKWLATPRTRAEIVARFIDAGRGLAAAHEQGLVHRDFKPENVLVGQDGRVRVTDFGLARRSSFAPLLTETEPDGSRLAHAALASLTRTGAFAGTPAYMAPEQLMGRPATARTDQFSFCVALYEALYGERPFAASTFEELVANVLGNRVRPAPPSTSVPPRLRRILLRGLEVDPARRHPSVGALLDAISGTVKTGARRGRTVFIATAGVIVVAVALVPLSIRSARVASAETSAIPLASRTDAPPASGGSATTRVTAAELAPPPGFSAAPAPSAAPPAAESPVPTQTSSAPALSAKTKRMLERPRASVTASRSPAPVPALSSSDPYDLRR
jgi:serine/threonine protein kinase